jgi:hypothetical protein
MSTTTKKAQEAQEEPTEFPLTLDEFLSELPAARIETKAGFKHVMEQEKETAPRLRKDWTALLDLYHTQPSAMSWEEWVKTEKATTKEGK